MNTKFGKSKDKLLAAGWGIKLAWKIDKRMFLFWTILSVALAVLPAIALYYNRNIIANLSSWISGGGGDFSTVVSDILILGIILTIAGLSTRFNDDFLYMTMYDSYYLGLEEVMMDSAQRIDHAELMKKEVNDDYFAAITRCGSLTDLMSSGCALLARVISMGSLLVVAFTVSKLIFFISGVYIILVFLLNAAFSEKVRFVWKETREKLRKADYYEKLPRNGDTAKEVRIFRAGEQILADWAKAYHDIERTSMKRALGIVQLTLISKTGFYVFMSIMMVYSLIQLSKGRMGPDLLLIAFLLCRNLSDAVSSVPKSYQQMDYGLYGLDIQRQFFLHTKQTDPTVEEQKENAPLDQEICFEAKNMSYSYSEDKPVLEDINFRIRKGETVALVGSNGAGKSTLVKLLLGLYQPTSGEVKFMGRQHSDYRKGFITERIGVFFQEFYLFHLTLAENVGIGNVKEIDDDTKIHSAIGKGGAASIVDKLKKGLNHLLGKQVYKDGAVLSGGEGQRVAVSRTHMSDKEVMIFDEPASMLDPIAEMEQFMNIRQKLEGRTAILVSHRIGFARLADRILVIDDGKLVEEGNHIELMNRNGIYARLFLDQAQWYETEGGDNPAYEPAKA